MPYFLCFINIGCYQRSLGSLFKYIVCILGSSFFVSLKFVFNFKEVTTIILQKYTLNWKNFSNPKNNAKQQKKKTFHLFVSWETKQKQNTTTKSELNSFKVWCVQLLVFVVWFDILVFSSSSSSSSRIIVISRDFSCCC